MELEFDKYCVVDGSPTTVLPAPRHQPKVEKRRSKGKPTLCLNEDFTLINFHRYHSVSCKDSPSKTSHSDGNEVLRRGSVSRSSKELRCLQKRDAGEERRKIDFSRGSVTAFSFGIVDALCSSDEDSSQVEENGSSVILMNSDLSSRTCKNLHADFFKSPFHPVPQRGAPPDDGENRYDINAVSRSAQYSNISSRLVANPLHEGNRPRERVHCAVLPKSSSAKFGVPHSPARSESDFSRASSSKSRFTQMKKMFDPFRKSKSQRSPPSNPIESGRDLECRLASLNGNKGSWKPLPPNFRKMMQHLDCGSLPTRKVRYNSLLQFLPTHLHGFLKLDREHGVPFFEFSVNFLEDVFLAKTWKVGNTLNWVYTFHSLHNRKKSHGSRCGSKDGTKESLLVGQMQLSSYLCTEVNNAGVCKNSTVMEFVLYDTAHPRKSVSSWDGSSPSSDVSKGLTENLLGGNNKSDEFLGRTKTKNQSKNADGRGHNEASGTHPWAAADLHQQLEIAAIVIEVPVQKRESLKFKSGVKNDQTLSNIMGFSFFDQGIEGIPCNVNPSKVVTVIPSGNHSLRTTESCGPSPLLDRWRSGGGCDCGGWDMACPLNVFYNPNTQIADDCPLIDNQRPLELFIQGKKDKMPALTVRVMEDGQYAVDFHAQLSSLQAFSICVAILHAMEASISVEKDEEGKSLMQDSVSLFVEDEVRSSIKPLREDEKQKGNKKVEKVQPCFVPHPPFSPIARV